MIGFCFTAAGIILVYFFLPTAVSLGLFAVLLYVWFISLLIGTSLSVIIQLGLKTYVKTLLGVSLGIIIIGMISMTSLSPEDKIVSASIFVVICLLVQYFEKHKSHEKERS
jgi:hypothetical protein